MTANSTSTVKEILASLLIACFVAVLASCAGDNDYNNVFVESSTSSETILSVGGCTVSASELNSTFNYTVANNAQDQEDVLVFNSSEQVKSLVEEDGYRSVLSTIIINLKGEQLTGNGATVYTINSITISGACADGQFDFNSGRMSVTENAQETEFTLPISEEWNERTINGSDEFESASEYSFHMIPQGLSNVQIAVDYTVSYDGYVVYRGCKTVKIDGVWSQGKTYSYYINLANGAQRISYNPVVK